ncbi:MAG TPA: hypothetical protein VKB51_11290, partial [bacterium]|nr:hypothetical protein [bacterium]
AARTSNTPAAPTAHAMPAVATSGPPPLPPEPDEAPPHDDDEAPAPGDLAPADFAPPDAADAAPVAPPAADGDTPADDGAPGADAPADEGPALCDDARWRDMVKALSGKHRGLAAKLRRAEVTAIEATAVHVLPGDPHNRPSAAELELVAPFLQEAFGDAFHIALVDDTNRRAREAHTITGRNRIEQAARIAARRAAAEGDPQVQRLLRFFPKGRVVEIALSDEPHPNRSDDV